MWKNLLCAVVLLFIASPASSASGAGKVSAIVADLAWMSGSWAGPVGEQTLEENWAQPRGGTIAALVRFVGDGATSMIELIVIEESEGSLVFRVQQWFPGFVPRTAEPQTMVLAEIGDQRVRFAGSSDGDFKSLSYSRPSAESFNIDVETNAGEKFQINLQAQ